MPAALEVLYLSQSQKEVKVLFSSLIFHFIFCNDYLKIKQFCENTFCHSDVLFLMTFAML